MLLKSQGLWLFYLAQDSNNTKEENSGFLKTIKESEKYSSNFGSSSQQNFVNSDDKTTFDNQFGTFNGAEMEGNCFNLTHIRWNKTASR